jgi:mRNA interferase HigB
MPTVLVGFILPYKIMHVISRKSIREFCEAHADATESLDHWYRTTKKAEWKNLAELKKTFSSADLVGKCFVFNIGGNKYRLIAKIYFEDQVCLIRNILTHKDYDRGKWKADCGL